MKVSTRGWKRLAALIPATALLACGGGGGGGSKPETCDTTGGGGTAGAYHIDLRYQTTTLTDQQKAPFAAAASRIEEIVTTSPSKVSVTWDASSLPACADPTIGASGTETIGGLVIFVSVKTLGTGVIAQSGPCILRSSSHLPAAAVLEFSPTYLASLPALDVQKTILHEMLHTLGFGTMWGKTTTDGFGWNLLSAPLATGDTFTGFQGLCGAKAQNGAPSSWKAVPVEDCTTVPPGAVGTCGAGTQDSHWRWAWYHNATRVELMTGWIDSGNDQPLSETTVASLQDIGYKVDLSKADAFTLPSSASSLRALDEAPANGFWLGDDVRKVPPLEVPED